MAGIARRWYVLPWGLVVAGISLRVLAITRFPVSSDAAEYAVLGRSILEGRGGDPDRDERGGVPLPPPRGLRRVLGPAGASGPGGRRRLGPREQVRGGTP